MVRDKFQLRRSRRYGRLFIACFSVVAITLSPSLKGSGESRNPENLQEVIWVGQVRFDYKKTERYKGKSSVARRNIKASNEWNETIDAHLTIKACGKEGSIHILNISGNFNLNYHHQYRREKDHESCLDERARVERIVRPGDREYENEQRMGSLSGAPTGTIELNLVPGSNTYYLSAAAEIRYRLTAYGESGVIWACSGEDQRSPIPRGPADDIPFPFGFMTTGSAGKETLGRKDLSPSAEEKQRRNEALQRGLGRDIDEGTGHYDETITAEWQFYAKDPCQDVIQHLYTDLAYAEAYADKKIQDFASTLTEYEMLVGNRAYTIRHGRPPSRQGGNFEEGGPYVDPETCEIIGLEEHRQKLADRCKPDIIIDSIEAHEELHQEQCETFNEEMKSGKPSIKGMMEVTAYKTGIVLLLDWLETHCPNYDTSRDRSRLDKIRN